MAKGRDLSQLSLINWDFKSEDSREFAHNFCWYPARFIPAIPAKLIQTFSHENDTVLDPFCGSGTTLIESIKLRRNAIGVDSNPISCFMSKVKIGVLKRKGIRIKIISAFANELLSIISTSGFEYKPNLFHQNHKYAKINVNHIPNFAQNAKWYHPVTLKMLAHIYNWVEKLPYGPTKDVCKLFFISILMPSTGYEKSKHYTYFADNVCPKTMVFKNSFQLYVKKLTKFIDQYNINHKIDPFPDAKIIHDDIRNLKDTIKDMGQVDLIVTSPPYLNAADYTTAYRLVYLWDYFRTKWQPSLEQEIGSRRRRMRKHHFNDYVSLMMHAFENMVYVLKNKSYLCLILGQSKKHHNAVRKIFDPFLIEIGLEQISLFSRNIKKKHFATFKGEGVQTEDILIYRKRRYYRG